MDDPAMPSSGTQSPDRGEQGPQQAGILLRGSGRGWQRMLSGRRLDLFDPSPADIDILDIAHGLARVARWNGQTAGPHAMTVAQHSLLVDDIHACLYPDRTSGEALFALLHDGPEYVLGDLISPFKAAIGEGYRVLEERLMLAIARRFNFETAMTPECKAAIKSADRISAYYEAVRLAGFAPHEADAVFGRPPAVPPVLAETLKGLTPMPTGAAQDAFGQRFAALSGGGGA